MLSYELCKSLKEAGFPQTGSKALECTCGNIVYRSNNVAEYKEGSELVRQPTLLELIEACPIEKLQKLCDGLWEACDETSPAEASGSTPEEAMAKLYLLLHEKSNLFK